MSFRYVLLSILLITSPLSLAQIGSPYDEGIGQAKPNIYRDFEPLDRSHSINQRTDVKRLFLDLGHNLKGDERDIPVMQRLLDLRRIQRDDIATQQALGLVLGDIIAKRLDMKWMIVEDKIGRSRALRYRKTDIIVFPITMISRRYKTGLRVDIQNLYDKTIANNEKRIAFENRGF